MKQVARTFFLTLVIALPLLLAAFIAPITSNTTTATSAIHSVADNNNPECLGIDCGAPSQVGATISTLHGIADANNPECLGISCGAPSQEGAA